MSVLITGVAGFIGYHVAQRLLARGEEVIGIDNLNPYYDVTLKEARLKGLQRQAGFRFHRLDISDRASVRSLFDSGPLQRVVHLAAQAGVRYSLEKPHAYVDTNLVGFLNVLEGCRAAQVGHLVYASSSSVYGAHTRLPFRMGDPVDHPVSLYAATKKANELMAHTYSHLFRLPTTGLRFFTVYGPWGRPDMALFLFTRAILSGQPIHLFNNGKMRRDFTYIDDIVEGVTRVMDRPATSDPNWSGDHPHPGTSTAPYRLYNIGNCNSVELPRVVELLEEALGRKAVKEFLPMQPGDVPATCANVDDLARDVDFAPSTPIEEGLRRFVAWYRDFYGPHPGPG